MKLLTSIRDCFAAIFFFVGLWLESWFGPEDELEDEPPPE